MDPPVTPRRNEPQAARSMVRSDRSDEPTDEELVQRIGAGQHHAFDLLVLRWAERVRGYLRQMVGERGAADDLLQDVLLQSFRSAQAGDAAMRVAGAGFGVWLFRVARNAAISHLRRRGVQARALALLGRGAVVLRLHRSASRSPLVEAEESEFAARFARALTLLPEEFRSVFLLREREGLSYEEIAAVMGIPPKTVSTRLVRARAKLRRELAEYLDVEPESPS